jgi:hypothetical protein
VSSWPKTADDGEQLGLHLPMTASARDEHERAVADGLGDLDCAAIVERLCRPAAQHDAVASPPAGRVTAGRSGGLVRQGPGRRCCMVADWTARRG